MARLTLFVIIMLLLLPVGFAATISFRSASSASGSGTTITCTAPSGTSTDDLLIAQVTTACIGGCTPPTVSNTGWTNINTNTNALAGGAFTSRQTILYKVATGSNDFTFELSGSSFQTGIACIAYDNVNTTDPFDEDASNDYASDSTPTTPSITTDTDDTLVFVGFVAGCGGSPCTWTPPSGFSERSDIVNTETADDIQAGAGSSGGKTATSTASGAGMTYIGGFRSELDAPAGDTCDYTSGTFVTDCSESCTVDTAYDLGGEDWELSGSGTIIVAEDVTNVGNMVKEKATVCNVAIESGNEVTLEE